MCEYFITKVIPLYCNTQSMQKNKKWLAKTYLSLPGFQKKGNKHKLFLLQNELKLWEEEDTYTENNSKEPIFFVGSAGESFREKFPLGLQQFIQKTPYALIGKQTCSIRYQWHSSSNKVSAVWHLPVCTGLTGTSKENHCQGEMFFLISTTSE